MFFFFPESIRLRSERARTDGPEAVHGSDQEEDSSWKSAGLPEQRRDTHAIHGERAGTVRDFGALFPAAEKSGQVKEEVERERFTEL